MTEAPASVDVARALIDVRKEESFVERSAGELQLPPAAYFGTPGEPVASGRGRIAANPISAAAASA